MFVFISLCLSVTKSVPTRRNWNSLMTLLISFVLIKILEFFDAVKNNRRNEVSRCYVAGFPTVAEIMIWPRRLIVSNITSHFLYLSVGR